MKNLIILSIIFFSVGVNATASLKRYDFTERMANCQNLEDMKSSDGQKIAASHYGTFGYNNTSDFITNCFNAGSFNSFTMTNLGSQTSCPTGIKTVTQSGKTCTFQMTSGFEGTAILGKNIDDQTKGLGIFKCNGGSWQKILSVCEYIDDDDCSAITNKKWNSNKCYTDISALKDGETKTFFSNSPQYQGSISVSCSNGNISYGTSTCNDSCSSNLGEVVNWSVGDYSCSGSVAKVGASYQASAKNGEPQTVSDEYKSVNDQIKFFYGSATFICDNGKWKIKSGTSPTCYKATNLTSGMSCTSEDVVIHNDETNTDEVQYTLTKCKWL